MPWKQLDTTAIQMCGYDCMLSVLSNGVIENVLFDNYSTRAHWIWDDRQPTRRASLAIHLINRFHVAEPLFSSRSQMTSKCGENKKWHTRRQSSVSLMLLRLCFPMFLNVSRDEVEGNIEILGKQIHYSPRDQSLSVNYYTHHTFRRLSLAHQFKDLYHLATIISILYPF